MIFFKVGFIEFLLEMIQSDFLTYVHTRNLSTGMEKIYIQQAQLLTSSCKIAST